MPTTSVPPGFGASLAAADGDAAAEALAAVLAGAAGDGEGLAAPAHARNNIATLIKSAVVRRRTIRSPPTYGC
jgi:hypothetical protein